MFRLWINGLEWSPLRSDHFQRKNYLYFANRENLRIFPVHFSQKGMQFSFTTFPVKMQCRAVRRPPGIALL